MPRYRYAPHTDPPAPFVYLALKNRVTGAKVEQVPAQLDTGADLTVLPQQVVDALGLRPGEEMKIAGFDGREQAIPTYAVDLAIRGHERVVVVKAASLSGSAYALLGLDALNSFRVTLDGPALVFDIE